MVSDGDGWKNYRRDVDLRRRSTGKWDTLRYLFDVLRWMPKFKDYDVVQLINPVFLDLRAGKIKPFYDYIRRHNGKLVLGAFGMDHYWVKTCLDCTTFRYSDFNIGSHQRTEEPYNQAFIRDWLQGEKTSINQYIAADADAIVTGLYEYDCCYRPHFPDKTHFIPFPIDFSAITPKVPRTEGAPIRFFVGIQRERHAYKGTDIMLRALERVKALHPDACEIVKVENVPFSEYQRLMSESDVILDQLYSYTPAMEQENSIRKLLRQALQNEQVRGWFAPDWNVVNECAIIDKNDEGIIYEKRPDRVISKLGETIVIDYKTGDSQTVYAKYKEQVKEYIDLLKRAGYKNVKGYLWYVMDNKVVPVSDSNNDL